MLPLIRELVDPPGHYTRWYLFNPNYKENTISSLKQQLLDIFAHDAEFISERDAHYESSWKARGGPGAFFTIARPWDRFAAIAKRGIPRTGSDAGTGYVVQPWDILGIIKFEQEQGKSESNDGTLQACIRDLRAYMSLLAVEAMTMRQVYRQDNAAAAPAPSPKEERLLVNTFFRYGCLRCGAEIATASTRTQICGNCGSRNRITITND